MKMESWFLLLDVILRDMHKRSGYTFISYARSLEIEVLGIFFRKMVRQSSVL